MGGCGLDYIKRAVAEGTPARGWLRRWRAYVGGEDEEAGEAWRVAGGAE